MQAGHGRPGVYNAGSEEVCDARVGLEGLEDGEDAAYAVVLQEEGECAEGADEDYAGKGFFGVLGEGRGGGACEIQWQFRRCGICIVQCGC